MCAEQKMLSTLRRADTHHWYAMHSVRTSQCQVTSSMDLLLRWMWADWFSTLCVFWELLITIQLCAKIGKSPSSVEWKRMTFYRWKLYSEKKQHKTIRLFKCFAYIVCSKYFIDNRTVNSRSNWPELVVPAPDVVLQNPRVPYWLSISGLFDELSSRSWVVLMHRTWGILRVIACQYTIETKPCCLMTSWMTNR